MKKLLLSSLLSLFSVVVLMAQSAGFNSSYAVFSINSGVDAYYCMPSTTSCGSNAALNGANLGTFVVGTNTLVLKGAEHNVYKCGGADITATNLNYRIYLTGSTPGSFISTSIGYSSGNANGCGGEDQQWKDLTKNVNVLSGLTTSGNYTLEIYSDAPSSLGTQFLSNSSANYKATFTVCNNSGALNGTYTVGTGQCFATLASAITALNAGGVSGPVTFNVLAGHTETAPSGGFSITATGTSANTITFKKSGSGANPTFTANSTLTAGALNDAIFKIIGGDYITIDGFTMLENANTTTAAGTNNMTEWGVALLYASTTNGAQNNTIQNCTIDLNRTYQNSFGIYSNSTHSATAVTTSATATTTAGGNSGLKIYANTITDVNNGIVIIGPTAVADANTGIDIGGTSAAQGNTITNFGTTGTFSGYFNVSGTVNGILIRNSNGFNISYNTITSSVGGVTAGTLNGIQVQASSNTPTATFTNNINNNSISLKSAVASGAMNGINYPSGSASATSVVNINNNNFTDWGHTVAASGTIIFITCTSVNLTTAINNNTFTNLSVNTTGSVTFVSNAIAVPATGSMNINGNSIVTGFTKTGAGGTITFFTSNASSVTGSVINMQNNNFSNITATGATGFVGINNTDGGSPTKTITGNTFNNISGGTGTINPMTINFFGATSSVSSNTITNISWGASITALTIGSSSSATTLNVASNIINNISSNSSVTGLTVASPSTITNINNNVINTLSSTGASAVIGISITGATTTNVFKNKIYGLSGSNASSTVNGIAVTAGTTVNLYNNIVGNLTTPAANAANPLVGLNITGGTTVNAYYNTVYLNGSSTGALFGSSAISVSTTPTVNLRNNIFANNSSVSGAGLAIAYRRSSTTLTSYASTSNNNLFYGTSGLFTNGTNTDASLAAYKTRVSTRDAASISENPTWVSTTGSDAAFLHINTTTPTGIESGGTAIATFTDDFDGDTRNASTPDIGADEFTGTPLPLCAGTPATSTINSAAAQLCPNGSTNLSLSATYTDLGISYQWASSTTAGGPYTNLGTGNAQSTGALTVTTYYICSVTCSYSGQTMVTAEKTIVVNPNPTPEISASSLSICGTGSVSLTASGADVYSWSPAASLSASTGTTVAASPTLTTTYTVTATNSLTGCFATTTTAVTLYSVVNATATATPAVICTGANSQLLAVGSQSYPTAVSTYAFAGSSDTYSAITGTTLGAGSIGDDVAIGNLPIGFTFNHNGVAQTIFAAASNGFIELGSTLTYTNNTGAGWTPSSNALASRANIIAPLWEDNNTTGGSIMYATTGTAPNRILTVQWTGMHVGGSGSSTNPTINMQVKLYETSNKIEFVYGSTSAAFTSTTASIGISGAVGNYKSVTPLLPVNTSTVSSSVENTTISSATNLPSGTVYTFTPTAAPSFTYIWSPTTFIPSGQETTSNPIATAVSTTTAYTVTVTGNGGCTGTASVTVTAGVPLVSTPTASATTICNGQSTTLNANVTGGGLPYTYVWSGSDGSTPSAVVNPSPSPTATTTYTVTVSDNCGSTTTGMITINVNPVPTAIAESSNTLPVCSSQTLNLIGTTDIGATFAWTGPNSFTSADQNPTISNVTTAASGVYSFVATLNGCNSTVGTVNITVNPTPSAVTVTPSSATVCNGSSVNLVASGGTIGGSGNATIGTATTLTTATSQPTAFCNRWKQYWCQTVFTAAELQAQGMSAGNITSITYNISTLGDATNVTNFSVHLGNSSNSTLSGFTTSGLTKVFGPATYNHSVGANTITFTTPYLWDGVSNIILDIRQNGADATNNAQTFFTATTGNNTVVHATTSSATPELWTNNPSATTSTSRLNTVFGWSNAVTTTYAWTPDTGLNATIGATVTATPSTTTTYTVEASSAIGCKSSNTATVTFNPRPTAVTSGGGTVCAGVTRPSVTFTFTGTAPFSFTYNNGTSNTTIDNYSSNVYELVDAPAGTYTVNALLDDNCLANNSDLTGSATVIVNPRAITNAGADVTINCTNPSTTLTATGGASYVWSTGETTASISVNSTTNTIYSVTATSAEGCTDDDGYSVGVIADFATPTVNAGMDVTIDCVVSGSTLDATGNAVSYTWNNGAMQNDVVSPTVNTIYSVTATGTNGCTAVDEKQVSVDKDVPTANAGVDVTVTCTNPTAILTATGGLGYSWLSGEVDATINVSPTVTTTYTVVVIADNGCTATDDVIVTADKIAPTANAGADVTVTCTTPNTILSASGGINYAWSTGDYYPMITVSPTVTTTYTVTVTVENGCTSTDNVVVTVDQTPPTVNAGIDVTIDCVVPSSTLDATGNAATYVWNIGAQNDVVSPAVNTTYSVTATGANGCTAVDEKQVSVDKDVPTAIAGADVTVTCTNPSATLTATGGISYSWLSGEVDATINVSPTVTTTYTVVVIADNGCTATDDVVVTVDKDVPTANAGADVTVTCSSPSTTLTAMGGVAYVWNNSASQGDSVAPTTTTTYTVTVTAANGCTSTDDVIVTADKTAPMANAGVDIALTTLNPNGTLMATGGGSYLWNTGETTASINISVTTMTVFTVTVTTANGCTDTDDVTVFYTNSDITPPVFTFVPANMTIDYCQRDSIIGQNIAKNLVAVTDDFPGIMVSNVQLSTKGTSSNSCSYYNYTVTNTWTATDASGNTSTAVQIITVKDVTAPTLTAAPSSFSGSQNAAPDVSVNPPTATNNCAPFDAVDIQFKADTIYPTKPKCISVFYNVTRTWTASDACGNTSATSQMLHIEDEVLLTCPKNPPVLTTTSDGQNNYNCSTLVLASNDLRPTFSDACDLSVLKYTLTWGTTKTFGTGSISGTTLNSGVTTVTYTAQFSNPVSCSFTVTVLDKEKPKINVAVPTVIIDGCTHPDTLNLPNRPTATDNCSSVPEVTISIFSDNIAAVSGCATKTATLKYTSLRTIWWKATDAAGNTATASQRFYLRDMQAPTAVCQTKATSVSNTNISYAASNFNNGSTDNCGGTLTFSACRGAGCTNFSTNLTLSKSLIPTGQNSAVLPITVRAIDPCGNTATCSTTLTLSRATTLGKDNDNTAGDPAISEEGNNEIVTPIEASDVDATHGSMKCFPNPFSEDLNINYNLNEDVESVVLKVYDAQGKLVSKLENGEQPAGYHTLRWNLSHLDASMYHVCLELNGKCQQTHRVLMMK